MENKFNLHDIAESSKDLIKFYKEEEGLHSVQPSSETAENLNQDDILDFKANLNSNLYDIFDSYILLEGNIQKRATVGDNQNWVALGDDNVTIEPCGFYKMFREMSLITSNDTEIEKVTHPGEVAMLNQFLMRGYDYVNNMGQLNVFLPDTATGTHANTEFIKRKDICSGGKFQVMLYIDSVFGFCQYVRASLGNLLITLRLHRNFISQASRKSFIYGVPAANTEYRVTLTKARWVIPYTKLNLKGKELYNKSLKNITFGFLANQMSFHKVNEGTDEFSINIGNIRSNVHEIIAVFKESEKQFNKNNSKYIQNYTTGAGANVIHHEITGLSFNIDNIEYPPSSFPLRFNNRENIIAVPYKAYLNLVTNYYDVKHPILSYNDFRNLYNIYTQNLRAQDNSYLNKNSSIAIKLTKSQNFTPDMYVLTKLEKYINLDPTQSDGQGNKITTLELVSSVASD